MALDPTTEATVKETFKTLEDSAIEDVDKPIKISPRRMRCLLLFSQQRMNVQIRGKVVVLEEDSSAPDLLEAIEAAMPERVKSDNISDEEVTPEELMLIRDMRAAKAREAEGRKTVPDAPRSIAELYKSKGQLQ